MTAHDKSSSLPAPISLTLEEVAQVSGGNFAPSKILIIGKPAELALMNKENFSVGGGLQTLPQVAGGLTV